MKKKLRSISVDGKEYKWSVSHPNCDGDWGSRFKIWQSGNLIHQSVVMGSMTPGEVRLTIQSITV